MKTNITKTAFSLLYGNLWKVDNSKLAQINPDLICQDIICQDIICQDIICQDITCHDMVRQDQNNSSLAQNESQINSLQGVVMQRKPAIILPLSHMNKDMDFWQNKEKSDTKVKIDVPLLLKTPIIRAEQLARNNARQQVGATNVGTTKTGTTPVGTSSKWEVIARITSEGGGNESGLSQSKTEVGGLSNVSREDLILDWQLLEQAVLGCTKCELSEIKKHTVFGRGNRNARFLFVGEAPDKDDDEEGRSFAGERGALLDKMITAMKLDVEKDVYISNVIKCCTLQNRHPLKSEINSCKRFLYSQIELVKPSIIIALGKFASQSLLNVDQPLNKLRGVQHFFKNIPVVVTFDPSYLLRNSSAKKEAWIDLQLALQISSNLA